MDLDVRLKEILAKFVKGDVNDMPIEQIKQAFTEAGYKKS